MVTFFGSHDAVRAERVALEAGLTARLIPGPKELSTNCGVALAILARDQHRVTALLEKASVAYEAVHPYHVRPKLSWLGRFLSGDGPSTDGR